MPPYQVNFEQYFTPGIRSIRYWYFSGSTFASETLLRTANRNADCSVVGGWVINFNAVRNVTNKNSDNATLSTVNVRRRLLRKALRTMNPGIVIGDRSAIHLSPDAQCAGRRPPPSDRA